MKSDIRRLTLTAVFAALVFLGTAVFYIPLPSGYANLGDCFVILGGVLLGPLYGAVAAALGSALSDIALGYMLYAPATFIIKAAMAVAVHFISKRGGTVIIVIAALSAEVMMVGGYFIFESFLYGAAGALGSVPGNLVQGAVGAVAGTAVGAFVKKSGVASKLKLIY